MRPTPHPSHAEGDGQRTVDFVSLGSFRNSTKPSGRPDSRWFSGNWWKYRRWRGGFTELLQFRLTALNLGTSVVWSTLVLLGGTNLHPDLSLGHVGVPAFGCMVLAATVPLLAVVWMVARPGLPIGVLRGLEVTSLGAYVLGLIGLRVQFLIRGLSGELEGEAQEYFLLWAAAFNGFGWMVLMVGYSVVVPNGWRRSAAYVLGLTLVPCTVDVTLATVAPLGWELMAEPLVFTALMLFSAAILSLFGTSQIAALREAVVAAHRKGRAMGPYVLERQLGVGNMGEVYLARHRLLKRKCAVKVIRPERAGDPDTLTRFDREVQATARLTHPNTVEIFDYGRTEEGALYYVMEYLDGLGLDVVVRRFGPMPAGRVVSILRQLCGALAEAHAHGLIHRDVKPSNILLCRYGGMVDVVKLVDFGLVRSTGFELDADQMTRIGAITGTPDFMSPEQADGANLDCRSDIYGVGATAFFLLTGRELFVGKTVLDILIAHRQQAPPMCSDLGVQVSPELERILQCCLAKVPEERFSSAEELDQALRHCRDVDAWSEERTRAWWRQVSNDEE